ncbi:hypothetical protein BU23DRAFT_120608 [Bimuria novae-zelandiae CBS 107.79]|uniref:Uncharacterized protein n=1 Tax=Bimuria novae-zelandiae CBS 107.79 TaxID=1447943 RepID=A0A6A5V9T2_9PLEO|nr:hypothetical protein BU23DRAFT_120608 [Bimuria novae-zelandiae CBS 107.79]
MMAATSATTGFPPPSFQIGVSTHKRYADCFPDRTLAVIARLHCEEVQAVMHAYQTSQPLHLQYRYAIVLATATGSATDFTITTIGDTTPSRSYANVRLLDHFLTINHRIAALSERPKYVILKTKEGIKNPKYAHLHAVRYDEVGCGFDEDNCLSLYVTELMGGERHTRALYVERTEASVEEAEKDAEEVEKEFHGVEETVEAPSAEPLKVERGT